MAPPEGKGLVRRAAIVLVVLLGVGAAVTIAALGRPVYWMLYANYIKPYHDGPRALSSDPIELQVPDPPDIIAPVSATPEEKPASRGTLPIATSYPNPAFAAEGETRNEMGAASHNLDIPTDAAPIPVPPLDKPRPDLSKPVPPVVPPERVAPVKTGGQPLGTLSPDPPPQDWDGNPLHPQTPLRALPTVDHTAGLRYERRQPVSLAGPVDPADYALTKERMHAIADEDDHIMVTWANLHYLDFVLNWVDHVEAVMGVKGPYVVGAMDLDMLQALVERDISCFDMASGLTTSDFGWGTKTFHQMGRKKIALTHTFTEMGLHMILSDVDTVWMRNPLPYVKQYPDADILTSSDGLTCTVRDEQLERWPEQGAAANIGIMLFRPSAKDFCARWVAAIEADENVWDQNAFNDLFRKGAVMTASAGADNLFLADQGRLKMGILPVSIFCSGHTYFVTRMPEVFGLAPYVVHATYQYSGTPGKRNRLRERLLWNDPPEYFDPPGGVLAYTNDVPAALLEAATAVRGMDLQTAEGHFRLVNHQLLQLRHALAIAQTLGRTLVLPELWCGLDRWWAPHPGTIPGSPTTLPISCPADHVLDLENGFHRKFDEAEAGRHIAYREYSYLRNPQLPATILSDRVVVEVCDDPDCEDGSKPATVTKGRIRMRPSLSDKQIGVLLSEVSDTKVVEFTTMVDAFGSHASETDRQKFMRRTREYVSLWCCIQAHPGHIWYDMWWDTIPHKDRHNREWTEDWTPMTGP